MAKIFDKLFFMGPMTLGDNFVFSGIAHYYGDRCEELHVPVQPAFYDSLKSLYQDHPHIKVVQLEPYDLGENQYVKENGLSRIIRQDAFMATIDSQYMGPLWDELAYSQFELPFSYRYSNFRLPKHIEGAQELYQQLSNNEPYVLVHRFTGAHPNGIPIDLAGFRQANNLPDLKIIEVTAGITSNMMQYVELIKNATEIHCVPSSFFCLVDSIHDKTNAKLFYHDVRATTLMRINSKWNNYPWTIVTYANKL